MKRIYVVLDKQYNPETWNQATVADPCRHCGAQAKENCRNLKVNQFHKRRVDWIKNFTNMCDIIEEKDIIYIKPKKMNKKVIEFVASKDYTKQNWFNWIFSKHCIYCHACPGEPCTNADDNQFHLSRFVNSGMAGWDYEIKENKLFVKRKT